eukprot:scaffold3946_cov177-Amphora_coffeaeformis.AAC.17
MGKKKHNIISVSSMTRLLVVSLLVPHLVLLVCEAHSTNQYRSRPAERFLPCDVEWATSNRTRFFQCLRRRADPRCYQPDDIRTCLMQNNFFGINDIGLDEEDSASDTTATTMTAMAGGMEQQPEERRRRQAMNTILFNCTSDFVTCARDRLREDIQQLPACARDSLQQLRQCAVANRKTCRATCRTAAAQAAGNSTTLVTTTMSQEVGGQQGDDTDGTLLWRTCRVFRNRVVRPLCRRAASCCPGACQEELAAVTDCFVGTIMQGVVEPETSDTTTTDCPLTCFAAVDGEEEDGSERFRRLEESWESKEKYDTHTEKEPAADLSWTNDGATWDNHRYLQQYGTDGNGDDSIFEACIELAPGLNPEQRNDPQELVDRLEFFDCVVQEMYSVVVASNDTEGDDADDLRSDKNTSGAATTPAAAWELVSVVMAVSMISALLASSVCL